MQPDNSLSQSSIHDDQLASFLRISRRSLLLLAAVTLASGAGYALASGPALALLALASALLAGALWQSQRLAHAGRLRLAVALSAISATLALMALSLVTPALLPAVLLGYVALIGGVALLQGATASWQVAWGCVLAFLLSEAIAATLPVPRIALPGWLETSALLGLVPALLLFLAALIRHALARLERRLAATAEHERNLEQQRVALESAIAARTQVMEKTLATLETQSIELRRATMELQNREETIRLLNVPAIPVAEGVLVLPLIGNIDAERAALVQMAVLAGIEDHQARYMLLDITGAPVIDAEGAAVIQQAVQGARLLGAEPALVGMRPEVAQTIVTLGLDLGGIRSYASLQQGLAELVGLRRQSYRHPQK